MAQASIIVVDQEQGQELGKLLSHSAEPAIFHTFGFLHCPGLRRTMQLSVENRKAFEARFNEFKTATKNLLFGCSVGLNAAPFQASGVIFICDTLGNTYILTAKHNLLRGDTPDNRPLPSTLVDEFTDKITIEYGAANFTSRPPLGAALVKTANNGGNAKIFGDPNQDNWDYDVMMVKSADPLLLAHAQQHALVRSKADLNKLGLQLSAPGLALKRTSTHVFMQIGFGYSSGERAVNDSFIGKFQVRFQDPITVVVAPEVFDYDEETGVDSINTNVVRIVANDENSTAPSDSGGPLLLIDSTNTGNGPPDVFLLGVTLGANQSLTARTPVADNPILHDTSNYVGPFICMSGPTVAGC